MKTAQSNSTTTSQTGTIRELSKNAFAAQIYIDGKQKRKRCKSSIEAQRWIDAMTTGTKYKPLLTPKKSLEGDKIPCNGGYYQSIGHGKFYAQIYAGFKQHRRRFGNLPNAEKWLAQLAGGEQPLTAWQITECKRAYQLVKEQGNGKSLLDCLQVGLNATSTTAITLARAIDEYLKGIIGSVAAITYNDYRLYLLQLQKKLGDDLNLMALSRASISDYLTQYKTHPHSYNHALRSLSAFANWAVKCEYLQSSPTFGLSKLQIKQADITFLTVDQSKKLLVSAAKTRSDMIPYLAISLFAGLRPWEVMRLTQADINMETGYIRLGSAKTKSKKGSGRMIPIRSTLKSWLELYPVHGELTTLRPVTINLHMRTLAKLAGVNLEHDILRHTYATYAHATDKTPEATAQAMGHSLAIAKAHYLGLVTEAQGKAFFSITPETLSQIETETDPEDPDNQELRAKVAYVKKIQRVGKARRDFEAKIKA